MWPRSSRDRGWRWSEPGDYDQGGNVCFNFFNSLCNSLLSCTYFLCCCWLLQDCFSDRPRRYPPRDPLIAPPYSGGGGGGGFQTEPPPGPPGPPFSSRFGFSEPPGPPEFGASELPGPPTSLVRHTGHQPF